MGIKNVFKNILSPIEDEDYIEFDPEELEAPIEGLSEYEKAKSKERMNIPNDTQMVLFEPRSFEEAEEVAKYLKERRAAVVNLHRLQRDYAQRTIDFLTGVVFALDGTIQKIGHDVILCTPNSVSVEGEISMSINEFDD
ncbi:MAG TPA: cell division protein SepF [Erysipelothrix sp.]|nr:cell division protein SepF [Erysipelothrix sp.]